MARAYLHYDVFTDSPLLGNQLAVFTDARGLSTEQMQRMANEMNFAESTFILPAERPDTGVRMRIFTPHLEMPMAGHPTIGSTFALAHTGVIASGTSRFVFGLNIGPVQVDLEWHGEELRFAWMTQQRPVFGAPIEPAVAATAIGLTPADLADDVPVQLVSCGVPYVLILLRDRETVDRAACDLAGFRRLRDRCDAETAVFLFCLTPGSADTVYSRMFAPGHGVAEDPATGSASGPLGCYLVEHGLVRQEVQRRITSRQGVAMGRASRIHIAIEGTPGAITDVKVGGQAVLVGDGRIIVD
jgi:trans-2,3-dihydro-3-hydroxyanthranilate isomerase